MCLKAWDLLLWVGWKNGLHGGCLYRHTTLTQICTFCMHNHTYKCICIKVMFPFHFHKYTVVDILVGLVVSSGLKGKCIYSCKRLCKHIKTKLPNNKICLYTCTKRERENMNERLCTTMSLSLSLSVVCVSVHVCVYHVLSLFSLGANVNSSWTPSITKSTIHNASLHKRPFHHTSYTHTEYTLLTRFHLWDNIHAHFLVKHCYKCSEICLICLKSWMNKSIQYIHIYRGVTEETRVCSWIVKPWA